MNHPRHEELVDFLDGELPADVQAEIAVHVADCRECGEQVAAWRSIRETLKSDRLSERWAAPVSARRRAPLWQTLGRVAAAVALLATGFAAARLTTRPPDNEQMRVELAAQIGDQLRSELSTELTRLAAAQASEEQAYHQAVVASVQDLDARWLADFGKLRKDIETVAVHTQAEFARLTNSAP